MKLQKGMFRGMITEKWTNNIDKLLIDMSAGLQMLKEYNDKDSRVYYIIEYKRGKVDVIKTISSRYTCNQFDGFMSLYLTDLDEDDIKAVYKVGSVTEDDSLIDLKGKLKFAEFKNEVSILSIQDLMICDAYYGVQVGNNTIIFALSPLTIIPKGLNKDQFLGNLLGTALNLDISKCILSSVQLLAIG